MELLAEEDLNPDDSPFTLQFETEHPPGSPEFDPFLDYVLGLKQWQDNKGLNSGG